MYPATNAAEDRRKTAPAILSGSGSLHSLAKRLHPHHCAQWRSADHRTWSSRRCCRRSKGTSNRLSPGRHTHSHDGACCSRILHQSVHDLENSITPQTAFFSMEAAAGLRPAPLGRKSADHPRCCHSYFGRGRIALPPLYLPPGRIEKIRIIEYPYWSRVVGKPDVILNWCYQGNVLIEQR